MCAKIRNIFSPQRASSNGPTMRIARQLCPQLSNLNLQPSLLPSCPPPPIFVSTCSMHRYNNKMHAFVFVRALHSYRILFIRATNNANIFYGCIQYHFELFHTHTATGQHLAKYQLRAWCGGELQSHRQIERWKTNAFNII